MPEDVTRDPVIGKLARFQPTAAGIDRDGMLFAAGRASARVRRWKALAAILGALQAGTLCAWLVVSLTGQRGPVAGSAVEPRPSLSEPAVPAEPMSPASYGGLAHWRDRDDLPSPRPVDDPVPSGSVLTIGASQRDFVVD